VQQVLSSDIRNQQITTDDPVYTEIHEFAAKNFKQIDVLNTAVHTADEVRAIVSNIIGEDVDPSTTLLPPVLMDFGYHLSLGKDVFINRGVVLVDLGGITIEDHVLIGPHAALLTVNHPLDPKHRRGLIVKAITIKRNAWIGANATILQGVTVGENSVVAAGATVTRDVPDNTVVAGVPAKVIKTI
jgi:acetyltransferase-like isoleucine patch superfamily enzyme